jgi:hypothetical protein
MFLFGSGWSRTYPHRLDGGVASCTFEARPSNRERNPNLNTN